MALDFQPIDIPLDSGIDTKTDRKLTRGNTVLENAVFDSTGSISKRDGYSVYSSNVTSLVSFDGAVTPTSPSITVGNSIFTSGNKLCIQGESSDAGSQTHVTGPGIFTLGEQNSTWVQTTYRQPMSWSINTRSHQTTTYKRPSIAVGSGLNVTVYDDDESDDNNTFYDVIDGYNGSVYIERGALGTAGDGRPKVVHVDNSFLVFAFKSSSDDIVVYHIDAASPSTAATLQDTITDVSSVGMFDVDVINHDGYKEAVVAYENTSTDVALKTYDRDGTMTKETSVTGSAPENVLGLYVSNTAPTPKVYVMFDTTTFVRSSVLDLSLNEESASNKVMDVPVNGGTKNITAAYHAADDEIWVFADSTSTISTTDPTARMIIYTKMNTTGNQTADEFQLFNQSLYSKAWSYNEQIQFITAHDDAYQPSYFVYGFKYHPGFTFEGLIPQACVLKDRGGRVRENGLAQVHLEDDVLTSVLMRGGRTFADGDILQGLSVFTLDLKPNVASIDTNSGKATLLGGGSVYNMDARGAELGFHLFPAPVSVDDSNATGGQLNNGVYQVAVVWEWVDTNGELHRSAPSNYVSHTVDDGTGTSQFSVTIRMNTTIDRWSKADYNAVWGHNIVAVLYRSEADSTDLYRASEHPHSVNITVGQATGRNPDSADRIISDREILYTIGELDNTAPPGSNIMVSSKKRVFLVPFDNPRNIWYSKFKQSDIATEFNSVLQIFVPEEGGDITGLGVIDDNVVVFKRNSAYVLAGTGLNDRGQGTNYEPRKLSLDVGCVSQASIAKIDNGLVFKSTKGIYLMDRSLTAEYIGYPVETYNTNTILSSSTIETKKEVRFVTDAPNILIYDYYHKRWGVFNAVGDPVDSTIDPDGKYTWITSNGTVCYEVNNQYLDNSLPYSMKVKTPWFKVKNLQGFQRIKELQILGEFKSDCVMNVNIYYDYKDTIAQTVQLDTSTLSKSAGDPLEFTIKPARQKCESIAIEVYDSNQQGTGESFSLSSITMLVGLKSGINKTSADISK